MVELVSRPQFVGRASELRRLEDGLASARRGEAVAVLVSGDAGVGKTRLIEELVSRAGAHGAAGLVGGCLDVEEGRLPFGPFIEALRSHVRTLDEPSRSALIGSGGEELARILPELRVTRSEPLAEGALAQDRLFELVLQLLGDLTADGPLVLVLEDLHWSDRSTRDLLAYLVRNLRSERVLLVGTYRSDELYRGHALRPFVAELERSPRLQRIDLHPFDRDELAEIVRGIVGSAPHAALLSAVFARSEGNPFFAEELIAAGPSSGEVPRTLSEIMLARVDRLSLAAQALLRVVAVGGRGVSDRLLEAVSAMTEARRLESLREAVAHRLLVAEASGDYVFRHELLREVVYHELLPEERSRLHAAYGAALSARPELASDSETVAGDLARHWFAAHDLPRALQAAVEAGQAAETRSGFAEARMQYERALELWDQVPDAERRAGLGRAQLARRAAEAANLAGEHGRAAAMIRAAIGGLDPARDPLTVGVMWERLGRFLWAAGDSKTALQAYEQAVALVPENPSAERARVLAARGQGLMLLARHEESRRCCEEAITIARLVGARAQEGHALNTLGCDLAYLGDPDTAVVHLAEARRIAEEVGDLDDLFRAYLNLSDLLGGPLNRLEEGLQLALDGVDRSQRVGMAGDYGVSLQCNAASMLVELGRLDEAREILAEAERRSPSEMAAIDLYQCWAALDLCRGRFERSVAHLRSARELMAQTVDPPYHVPLYAIEAELALWQGRPSDARAAVAQGLRQLDGIDDPWLMVPLLWLALWAEADSALGTGARQGPAERARAQESGAESLARVRALLAGPQRVSPRTRAYALLCEAESDRRARSASGEGWERAAETWSSLGHPYREAYARWRHAEALLALRQASAGAAALRRAHHIAARIGAEPLRREIEMLARRARVQLPAGEDPGGAAIAEEGAVDQAGAGETRLTPRQLEVLALVAAGKTNREIAQTLFITEKTAGAHVSGILAALGVRSRVEAATTAHRLGLVSSH